MSLEPKLIEVPGIPGKLREQTLDEFLSVLTHDHLARQQLNEIRAQALKSVELSTQLMQANEKILELQNKLMAIPISLATSIPAPSDAINKVMSYMPESAMQGPPDAFKTLDPRSGPFPKAECPHCKKMVSSAPGPWSIHQRNTHPDNQAPRPQV